MANPRSLSNDFEKVFNKEKFSDIALSVNGKLYPAHKIILAARSDVFADMLSEQRKDDVIEIEDVNAETMEEILRYIYTEKVERIDQLATELLIAADKYGLEELKTICGKALFKTVSVSNALDMLKIASKHNAKELKRDVIEFVGANKYELFKTEAWQELQLDELNFQMIKELYEASIRLVLSTSISPNVSQRKFITVDPQNIITVPVLNKPPLVTSTSISSKISFPSLPEERNATIVIKNPQNSVSSRNSPYSRPH